MQIVLPRPAAVRLRGQLNPTLGGTNTNTPMQARTFMRAVLSSKDCDDSSQARSVGPGDVDPLGRLMYSAYFGTTDYEGETPEQAAEEVSKTLSGEYGEFNSECSKVIERADRIVSATLVTRCQGRPFVAFTMTDPEFKNQGLGAACMRSAMGALRGNGESEIRLVVTLANSPAVALYAKLGFTPESAA